jgi:hypothetical protein
MGLPPVTSAVFLIGGFATPPGIRSVINVNKVENQLLLLRQKRVEFPMSFYFE